MFDRKYSSVDLGVATRKSEIGSLLCCIPELLRLLTERLRPLSEEPSAKEVETENSKVAVCKPEEPSAKELETENSNSKVDICEPLPQELVTDILSRLPADSLYQCAKAYKDWNSFFSTHYFIHVLFLPRASPTIIVYRGCLADDELFYLDGFGNGCKITPITFKVNDDPCIRGCLRLSFSSFGLLFFTNPYLNYAVVVNPETCEKIYLFHDCGGHTDICGVYYHPIAKEFCVLLVSQFDGDDYIHFKLLKERGPSCWTRLSSILYLPLTLVPPVYLNGALHWMRLHMTPCSDSIVLFSVVEEEFKLMPHPAVVPVLNLNGKSKMLDYLILASSHSHSLYYLSYHIAENQECRCRYCWKIWIVCTQKCTTLTCFFWITLISGTNYGASSPKQIKKLEVPHHCRVFCNFCGKSEMETPLPGTQRKLASLDDLDASIEPLSFVLLIDNQAYPVITTWWFFHSSKPSPVKVSNCCYWHDILLL
ncbi:hypothetical protein AgCh_000200 [Apium graveolens]